MKKYFLFVFLFSCIGVSTFLASETSYAKNQSSLKLSASQRRAVLKELDTTLADLAKILADFQESEDERIDDLNLLASNDSANTAYDSQHSSVITDVQPGYGGNNNISSLLSLSSRTSSNDDQTNTTLVSANGSEMEQVCSSSGLVDCSKEAACRKMLAEKVGFKNKGEESGLFNNSCPRTRVSGLKSSTLAMLAYLREGCDKTMGDGKCRITITAGRERGHSATGAHPKGLGVDLSQRYSEFNNFIKVNRNRIKQATGCSCVFEGAGANVNTTGAHWHCGCSN